MGLVIKESIKSTITSFSGAVLGLITMVLSVKFFSQDEYGFYQTILKNCTILGYVFILGFDYTLLILGQRFGTDPMKSASFLRYTMKVPILFFGISLIIFFACSSLLFNKIDSVELSYYKEHFFKFPAITFLYLVLYWTLGFLRSKNLSTFAYFLQDVVIRIGNIVLIILYGFGWIDFTGFMIGLVLSILVPVIMAIKKTYKHPDFNLKKAQSLNISDKKYILEFSFYHMMVVLASMMIFHIDSFLFPFINNDGLKNVGIFSLCLYVMSVIRMPLRVVGLSATPTLTTYYDESNQSKLQELFSRSALNLQLLGGLLCVLVLVNIDNIQWILDQWKYGYHEFKTLIPILIIGVWIEMCLGINFEMIGISRYFKYSFWMSIFYLIISVIGFVLLTHAFGLIGAAWAFSIALIFFSLLKSIFVMKKLHLSPWSTDSLKVIATCALMLLISFLPLLFHPVIDLIIKSLLIVVTFTFISLKWQIGEDVRHIYNKLIKKIS